MSEKNLSNPERDRNKAEKNPRTDRDKAAKDLGKTAVRGAAKK